MEKIKRVLENQKEIEHLCYFVYQDERTGSITMQLTTVDITKKLKFKDEITCLNKLVDVLFELKKLEKWNLNKQKKEENSGTTKKYYGKSRR